ncbi:MAG: hypothetical protein KJ626_09455 [Verrucomicrobia bacterium]|nr:hypothetical protein [Verrucomicrobiota bacterium]
MKAQHIVVLSIVFGLFCGFTSAFGQDAETETPAVPRILVILPEQVDVEWFWYHYTAQSQHIVQTAIEQELVRAGFDLVDVSAAEGAKAYGSIDALLNKDNAIKLAKELGAQYVIIGQASAVRASHDVAYGVNVYRSEAVASAKIIRVEDGKILDVVEIDADAGGQSQRTAGRDALKDAGKSLAKEVRRQTKGLLPPE